MTSHADLPKIFDCGDGPRVVALTERVGLAHSAPGAGEAVSAVFSLLTIQDKTPSGHSLLVVLTPKNALQLAKLIQIHAQERGWPELPESKRTTTDIPPSSQSH